MSDTDSKTYGIEKFEGSFEKEEGGCSIVINSTVNSIKNMDAAGLYMYLICRPSGWKLHPKQLAAHFDCNKDKIYKCLQILMDMNLLSRTEARKTGRFAKPNYLIHLHATSPCLEKPDAVKPDTEKADTYKTKKLLTKEKDKNNIGDSSNAPNEKSVDNYKEDKLFTKFYLNYPNKQKPKEAYKEFKKLKPTEEFVNMLVDDINKRRSKDKRWQTRQYIPHPTTYLRTEYWMGDLVIEDAPKQKYPTKEERAENEKQIKKREEEAARLKREEIEASKNFKDTLFR